jgi:hypothetical protein
MHWKVMDLNALSRLHTSLNTVAMKEESSKSDERMNAKMMENLGDIYIKVHSLGPDTLSRTADGDVADWESGRAVGLTSLSQSTGDEPQILSGCG